MPLSETDQLAWTTPTARAEAVYQATRPVRRSKDPLGPAGLRLPDPGRPFDRGKDAQLLRDIVATVARELREAQAPDGWKAAVGVALLQDLRERYPGADMAVLARWRFAAVRTEAIVTAAFQNVTIPLPEAVLVPRDCPNFTFDAVAREANAPRAANAVPDSAREALGRWFALEEIEWTELKPIVSAPLMMAGRLKRAPIWGEIEAAWPRLGGWLADQRGRATSRVRSAA